MSILRLATLGALGYAGYRYLQNNQSNGKGFAYAGKDRDHFVRDAGAEAVGDKPGSWEKPDFESDQSFPASDPPTNY
ncbi:MAG: hypothetical protein DI636_08685 [Pelagerythrobacter marensis]|uniref:hypothetical protein n=1 Tax=Qipengyuania sp. YIM B01966 TaxID=2778646 RepID=UPI000DB1BF1B|nr:hypothetical protein [Qipengyuania sp. YIM B01966]PZO68637.1 MAG: hypothetical protein DI636_08685 [Pelagerythrobacter marensis]PZU16025.1 MAG: hypothetical protein DI591_08625 [Citromicrobium sp.]